MARQQSLLLPSAGNRWLLSLSGGTARLRITQCECGGLPGGGGRIKTTRRAP